MKVTLDGKTYQRIGDEWFDENFITPPGIIVQRLNQRVPHTPAGKAGKPRHSSKGQRPSMRLGQSFTGLQATDFQRGTDGTTWRQRASLGGLLAQHLSDKTGQAFLSFDVYRRAQVYIAMPDRFDTTDKFPYAKFDIRLSEERAQIGFYVEKRDKAMSERWDWHRFMRAIADEAVQARLTAVMEEHTLYWMLERHEGGELVGEAAVYSAHPLRWEEDGVSTDISWPEFAARLQDAPPRQWLDLRLGRTIAKAEALNAGIAIADQVATVYAALMPLYDRCTLSISASRRLSAEDTESSFSQKEVFPIIADIINQLYQTTGDFVLHETIVTGLLNHAKGRALVESAQALQENDNTLEAIAGNMVAWFSQRITIHASEYEHLFIREQIGGKWAYRPVD